MTTVTIDNKTYDLNALPEEAKQQLALINFCDQETARLNMSLASLQAARAVYGQALKENLAKLDLINSDGSLL